MRIQMEYRVAVSDISYYMDIYIYIYIYMGGRFPFDYLICFKGVEITD